LIVVLYIIRMGAGIMVSLGARPGDAAWGYAGMAIEARLTDPLRTYPSPHLLA